jgi:hypothetical protein
VQFLFIGLQLPPEQEHNLGQSNFGQYYNASDDPVSDAGYVWIVTTIQLSKFIAQAMEELLTDNSTKPLQRKHNIGTRQFALNLCRCCQTKAGTDARKKPLNNAVNWTQIQFHNRRE